jgi:hypothetical protein
MLVGPVVAACSFSGAKMDHLTCLQILLPSSQQNVHWLANAW